MTESLRDLDPRWVDTVVREACLRRCVIVHGAVRDEVWDAGAREYVSVPRLLARRLADELDPVMVWDRSDGLGFEDDRSRREVERAANATGGRQVDEDLGFEPVRMPGEDEDSWARGLAEPHELIPVVRRLLETEGLRPLVVMDWCDWLVSGPDRLDGGERDLLVRLGKVLRGEDSFRVDERRVRQATGGLIIVTASLGAIPPSLYQADPRVKRIAVPTPDRPTRLGFFERHQSLLACDPPSAVGNQPQGRSDAPAVANRMADLTEDMQTADLRQLLALSHRCGEPLPPERLVNLYRFGERRSPWEDLDEGAVRGAAEVLGQRVLGQGNAIDAVSTMIARAHLGLSGLQHSARPGKPKGTLFFVGPTGVGKTELAKATAHLLFGDEAACIRFDMSEYNHEHSDARFVGAPPGYVGFEEGGQLTNAVMERPFSVLLFDEIEKAHPRILDKFLQVLEDGRLTDGRGETAVFSECVLIFTSNLGAGDGEFAESGLRHERHFRNAVRQHFVEELGRPELLNRLGDNIVVFDEVVDRDVRRGILVRKLAPLANHLRVSFGVDFRLNDAVVDALIERSDSQHGGRGLLNAAERLLLNPLTWFLLDRRHQCGAGRTLVADWGSDGVSFGLVESKAA